MSTWHVVSHARGPLHVLEEMLRLAMLKLTWQGSHVNVESVVTLVVDTVVPLVVLDMDVVCLAEQKLHVRSQWPAK